MYNVKSIHADEFIDDSEILETLAYAEKNKSNRVLIEAIIDKVLDRPVYELPGTILDLAQYVTSDMKTSDIVALGLAFAGNDVTMYSCTGPSDGDIIESYGGLWFCYPNPEGLAALMAEVDSGQEPGEIDYEATQVIVS